MLEKALLWKIEQSGNTSYLYGSIHIQDKRAFIFTNQLKHFIGQTDAFACEYNLDEARDLSLTGSVRSMTTLPSCSALMSAKLHKKAASFIQRSLGATFKRVLDYTPFQAIQLLQMASIEESHPLPLDQYLWNHASKLDKRLLGLETFESQWDLLQTIEQQQTIKDVIKVIRRLPTIRKTVNDLVQLYTQQDIVKLYKKSRKSLGKHRRVMIAERNQIMASNFEAFVKEGTLFAAVGAAHLPGKFGLLRLLKLKGFAVKAVELSAIDLEG